MWVERSRAIHENQAAKSAAGIWIDVVAGGLVSDPDVAKQLGLDPEALAVDRVRLGSFYL